MYDCHVHSSFSGDSVLSAEEACKKAIELGLEGIAFTDHLDIDYPGTDDFSRIDFFQYETQMLNLKHIYQGRLNVLLGIEVGIQPHIIDESLKVVESHPFDFVINSVHIIDGLDPYTGDFTRDKSKKEAYERYLKEVLFSVSSFSNYDILGHIDYIRRYGDYEPKKLDYPDYRDIIDEILKVLIYRGKGLEINAGGFRYSLKSPLMDVNILKRYKELGGDLVSTGSDTHSILHIGHNFDIVKAVLQEAGFTHTVHYENRKPVFDKL